MKHTACIFLSYLFSPLHVCLLLLGVFVTYLSVVSGFDWNYFLWTYTHIPKGVLFIADGLGFLIPFLVVVSVFLRERRGVYLRGTYKVLAASILSAFVASMVIKTFTGRISPPHHGPFDVDISHLFQFGFMEHHIIGGWPSSHAAVMVALLTTFLLLVPLSRAQKAVAIVATVFVAIGVTFGFHLFSEFVMGSLLGVVIGRSIVRTATL